MTATKLGRGFAVALTVLLASATARADEPVRIGLIEPFSGPIAAVGRGQDRPDRKSPARKTAGV